MALHGYSWFGLVFIAGGIISLLAGRTYCRGVIDREETPFDYWFIVGSLLAIGVVIINQSISMIILMLTMGGSSLIFRAIFCLNRGQITGAFGLFNRQTRWYFRNRNSFGFWAAFSVHLVVGTLMLVFPVLAMVSMIELILP
jgi:hypothetical protein